MAEKKCPHGYDFDEVITPCVFFVHGEDIKHTANVPAEYDKSPLRDETIIWESSNPKDVVITKKSE
jgi:hypothetical protein